MKSSVSEETFQFLLAEKERYRTALLAIRDHDLSGSWPLSTEDRLRYIARSALEESEIEK